MDNKWQMSVIICLVTDLTNCWVGAMSEERPASAGCSEQHPASVRGNTFQMCDWYGTYFSDEFMEALGVLSVFNTTTSQIHIMLYSWCLFMLLSFYWVWLLERIRFKCRRYRILSLKSMKSDRPRGQYHHAGVFICRLNSCFQYFYKFIFTLIYYAWNWWLPAR